MGRPFMNRTVESIEAERLVERIGLRLAALGQDVQVREYVMDEYLVLYVGAKGTAGEPDVMRLIAIKHQRQLGFDLPDDR
jgi:hypothetical protein